MVSPYLRDTEDLLTIQWGQTIDWDMKFPDAPAPFNDWFPAISYDRRLSSLQNQTVEGAVFDTEVPKSGEGRTISISFLDDEYDTLTRWLGQWQLTILGKGKFVQGVNQAVKPLYISRLSRSTEDNLLETLYVWPMGEIMEIGRSGNENGLKTNAVTFFIAGREGGARTLETQNSLAPNSVNVTKSSGAVSAPTNGNGSVLI